MWLNSLMITRQPDTWIYSIDKTISYLINNEQQQGYFACPETPALVCKVKMEKVKEEIGEFQAEVEHLDADAAEAEMGDVLFSLINAARLYHINPDNALERTNRKFIRRFNYLEATLRRRGQDFKDLTLAEMDQIWDEAKRQEETH